MTKWVEPEFVAEATNERVTFELELPEFAGQVLIHASRLNFLRKMAGASVLTLASASGNTSWSQHSVVGVTDSGEAIAGIAAFDSVKSGEGKINSNTDELLIGRPGVVTINIDEIYNRIADKNESLRSAAAWSSHLNDAIGEGIINLSDQMHVVDRFKARVKASALVASTFALTNSLLESASMDSLESALLTTAGGMIISSASLGWLYKPVKLTGDEHEPEPTTIQPSPFFALRIERALATRAVADFVRTVKPATT